MIWIRYTTKSNRILKQEKGKRKKKNWEEKIYNYLLLFHLNLLLYIIYILLSYNREMDKENKRKKNHTEKKNEEKKIIKKILWHLRLIWFDLKFDIQ